MHSQQCITDKPTLYLRMGLEVRLHDIWQPGLSLARHFMISHTSSPKSSVLFITTKGRAIDIQNQHEIIAEVISL